jgi:hypothetical protein
MATKRPDGSLKKINSAQFLPQVALYRDCPIQQPAAFLRYTTLWNYRFDTALRIASDYKLWVNMLLNGVRARFVNQIITLFAPAGISSNLDERNEEVIQIFRDIGMPKILIVLSHFKMFVAAWLRRHIKR